jgi:hypothetical protein
MIGMVMGQAYGFDGFKAPSQLFYTNLRTFNHNQPESFFHCVLTEGNSAAVQAAESFRHSPTNKHLTWHSLRIILILYL